MILIALNLYFLLEITWEQKPCLYQLLLDGSMSGIYPISQIFSGELDEGWMDGWEGKMKGQIERTKTFSMQSGSGRQLYISQVALCVMFEVLIQQMKLKGSW